MTLEEAIEIYTSNAEHERTHGSLQGCMDFKQLAEWLKELKQLREQTRWIPVSERLPDNTDTATGYYCNGRWWWYSATCQDYLNEYGRCDVDAMGYSMDAFTRAIQGRREQ